MPRDSSSPSMGDNSRGGGLRNAKVGVAAENCRSYKDIDLSQDKEAESHHGRIAEEHHDVIRKVRMTRAKVLTGFM